MRIAIDHREAILVTAARLFARKPFHEVLMEDVATNAGIAKGTVYRYYPNKDDLFAALSLRFLERLTSNIESSAKGVNPVDDLRAMIESMIEFIDENNDFFKVMLRRECEVFERKSSEFAQRRTSMRNLFATRISDAEKAGLLRCPFDAETAADMLLGMVRNILRFRNPPPSPPKLAEMVMHVFVNGLGTEKSMK